MSSPISPDAGAGAHRSSSSPADPDLSAVAADSIAPPSADPTPSTAANPAPSSTAVADPANLQADGRWKRPAMRHITCNINGYIRLNIVASIRTELAIADSRYLDDFGRSCFGHFLRHGWDRSYICNAAIHALFSNEVIREAVGNDSFVFRVGKRELIFSRREYALVTGLKFGPSDFDIRSDEPPPEDSVYIRRGPLMRRTFDHIRDAFIDGQFRDHQGDALKVAKILALGYLVMGWDGQHKIIDPWIWRLVEDADGWDRFPWGLYSWQVLRHYIQDVRLTPPTSQVNGRLVYHVYGNYYALMVWVCEAVPDLKQICVKEIFLDSAVQRPRLTCYLFKRVAKHDFTTFFDDDRRVCHERLVPTPEEEGVMYLRHLDDPIPDSVRYQHAVSVAKRGRTDPEDEGDTWVGRGRRRTVGQRQSAPGDQPAPTVPTAPTDPIGDAPQVGQTEDDSCASSSDDGDIRYVHDLYIRQKSYTRRYIRRYVDRAMDRLGQRLERYIDVVLDRAD